MKSFFEITKNAGYLMHFYNKSARGMIRKQKIDVAGDLDLSIDIVLTRSEISEWNHFFGLETPDFLNLPYFSKEMQLVSLQYMFDLGFNYKNMLHLGRNSTFFNKPIGLEFQLKMSLLDISRYSESKLVFVFQTDLTQGSKPIQSLKDFIYLKGVDSKEIANLFNSDNWGRTDITKFRGIKNTKASLIGPPHETFKRSPKLGWSYGFLSGDLNPAHTMNIAAKIFGFQGTFIQGACTYCHVISLLGNVSDLKIRFCNPLYFKKKYYFRKNLNTFEIFDDSSVVQAKGTFSSKRCSVPN